MARRLRHGIWALVPALMTQTEVTAQGVLQSLATAPLAAPDGDSPASAATVSTCDWLFQGIDCVPASQLCLRGPNDDVGTFGECFVGQSVGLSAMGTEVVSGTPAAPLSLAVGPDSDGVMQFIGTMLGLSGNGCAPGSLGMGAVSVLFDSPQSSVRVTPFFGTGGLTHVRAYAADGSLLAAVDGLLPVEVMAHPGQRPIAGLTIVSDNPGGTGYRFHTQLWNAILSVNPVPSSWMGQSLEQLLATLLALPPTQAVELTHGIGDEMTLQLRLAEAWDPALESFSVLAVPAGAAPGGPTDFDWPVEILAVREGDTLVTASLGIPEDTPAGSYAVTVTLRWIGCGASTTLDTAPLGFPITIP